MRKIDLRVADLFAGMGGLGTGFSKHFNVDLAIDWDYEAYMTYKNNHKYTDTRNEDVAIQDFGKKDFDMISGFVGGAPCQGFSNINAKRTKDSIEEDERNNYIYELVRATKSVKPDFVLMENVQGVPKEIKKDLAKKFRKLGYKVVSKNIRCWDYGSVQLGKRWILVASLHGHVYPDPIPESQRRTAKDILRPNIESDITVTKSVLEQIQKIEVRDGKLWYPLPNSKGVNYCMVQPDKHIGKILNFTKMRYVKPDRTGYLSSHEMKLAQGFPPDYEIYTDPDKSPSKQRKSIGQQLANAVPVETAEMFSQAIYDHILESMNSLSHWRFDK